MPQISIKDWEKLQHYKDRRPVWIKLYHEFLDNYDFQSLPVESRALLPMLWLVVSESVLAGCYQGDIRSLAFRLRQSEQEVTAALKPLNDKGFIVCSSDLLAGCYQVASTEEKRTETEQSRVETESTAPSKVEVAPKQDKPKNETPKRSTTTTFPYGEQCPPEWANWAGRHTSLSQSDIDREYASARDWALAKGERKVDWSAFFRNWCRRAEQPRVGNKPSAELSGGAAVFARVVAARENAE